jgi:hypothetical protein
VLGGLSSGWLLACAAAGDGADPSLGDQYEPSAGTGGTGTAGSATATAGTTTGTAGTGTSGSATGGSSGSSSVGGGSGAGGSGGAVGGSGGAAGAAGSGGGGGSGGANGNDLCPDDPDKTAPGKCGCGTPDTDSVKGASCVPLQTSLVHRYSFEADAKDSVGSAHGTLMGGATISGGALNLTGGNSGEYLDLPNALISTLTSATIEAYVTWTGAAGGDWQRIFDFGSSNMAEGTQGTGNKYLFLSARKLRACYTNASPTAEIFTDSATDLTAQPSQLAVVVNATAHNLTLYLDGTAVGSSVTLNESLSAINDVNNWLGRSQFAPDDYFAGKISEFRIYDAALTGPELKTSKQMGENTTYLKP